MALLQKGKSSKKQKTLLHLEERCMLCSTCEAVCPKEAIIVNETFVEIIEDNCTVCGICVKKCPTEALVLVARE